MVWRVPALGLHFAVKQLGLILTQKEQAKTADWDRTPGRLSDRRP
jgi:hypothetical protein